MTRVLLKKCIHEGKWLLLATMATTLAFAWLRVWIVARLDAGRFKAILDLLPAEWQRFTPVDFGWLMTYTGRISLVYDELIVVLCVSLWAIARGSDCVSGELGRGTMELLLAQPVSRLQVLLTHASVTVVGVAMIAGSTWLGSSAGIHTTTVREEITPTWELPFSLPGLGAEIPRPFAAKQVRSRRMSELVDVQVLLPATANLFALGILLAGVSTLMSSWDQYRWRTIGIVVGAYVVELILKIAGMASDSLAWLLYGSVFTAYEPEAFVRVADMTPDLAWSFLVFNEQGRCTAYGPLWYDGILLAVGCGSYAIAAVIFCRRDLPPPL